jgi:AcrR family transcriptional regulator
MVQEELQTRDKILQTAFGLFLARGYENTPVQAIIDAVGIAKGTFYHHFKGKEEMLISLVEGLSQRVVDAVAPIVDDPNLDAAAKMLRMSQAAVGRKSADLGPEAVVLVQQMRSRANRLLADSIQTITFQWLKPLYTRCIAQGVAEGLFRVRDPDLTADFFLGAVLSLTDRLGDLYLACVAGDPDAPGRIIHVY